MSEMPISPLRRRMIEDMTVRQFVEKTQADYVRHVRTFASSTLEVELAEF
jgi:integrase/recombinase XerD